MGDSAFRPSHNGPNGEIKKRKSLFGRITDSISSYLPSFFESKDEEGSSLTSNIKRKRPNSPASRHGNPLRTRLTVTPRESVNFTSSRLCMDNVVHTHLPEMEVPSTSLLDVDLDAKDDASDCSVSSKTSISTSGVSSLLPHRNRDEINLSMNSKLDRNKHKIEPSFFTKPDHAFEKSSFCSSNLWIDFDKNKRPSSSIDQPAQKRMRTDSSQSCLSGTLTSPFNRGKVSYGGASSLRSYPTFRNMFEHVAPLRFIVETPDESASPRTSHSTSNAVLSTTAKRILESLERHTCPIASSDRIPLPQPTQITVPLVQPLQRRSVRYPPYMAAFRRYKAGKQNNSQIANATIERQQSLLPSFTYDELSEVQSYGGGVVRSDKISKHPHSPISAIQEQTQLSINHSTSQKTSLPKCFTAESFKFDVDLFSVNKSTCESSTVITSKPDVKGNNDTPFEKNYLGSLRRISSSPTFKFSSPIILDLPVRLNDTEIASAKSQYTFSQPKPYFKRPTSTSSSFLPILLSNQVSAPLCQSPPTRATFPTNMTLWRCESCMSENASSDTVCKSCRLPTCTQSRLIFGHNSDSSTTNWECPSCMVSNKLNCDKCVCCQTENPTLSTSSIISDASTFKTIPISEQSSASNTATTTSSWECSTCMISNKPEINTCVCCQTAKPALIQSLTASSPDWECPSCMVSNKSSLSMCACCQTKQPSSPSVPTSTTPNLFKEISPSNSSSSSKWECPTCMATNEAATPMCACCQTSKPGSSLDAPKTVALFTPAAFKFGTSTTPTPSSKWECPTCMVTNKGSSSICPCCQTSIPLGKSTPKLAFNSDSPPIIMSTVKKSSAPLFNFGIPPPSSSSSDLLKAKVGALAEPLTQSKFKFGNFDSTSSETSKTSSTSSSLNCLPKLTFGASSEPSTPPTFTFGNPVSTLSATTKPSSTSSNLNCLPKLTFGAPAEPSTPSAFIFGKPASTSSETQKSGFSLGFKSANFPVVKPSPPLQFGTAQPKATEPVSGLHFNGGAPFKFGATSTPTIVNGQASSETNVPPTFNFGVTQMKENVTPAISNSTGFNFQGGLFSKPSAETAAAQDGVGTVIQETAPIIPPMFKFGDGAATNSATPFAFGGVTNIFSVASQSTTSPKTGAHGRPIRRAVRRYQRS